MWLLLLPPLVHAMVLPLDPGGGNCSYAVDCNSRACQDCSCVGGACQCADGFSGPNCGVRPGTALRPELSGVHSAASPRGAIFGRGFDPAYGESRQSIVGFKYTGGFDANFNQWTQPETGQTFDIPDCVNIYAIPGRVEAMQRHTVTDFKQYMNWTTSVDTEHTIAIFYNDFRASAHAQVYEMLQDNSTTLVLNRQYGTYYKIDICEPQTLKAQLAPGGNQSGTSFARDQALLPADRSTPENKHAYNDFLAKYGTHVTQSVILGMDLITFVAAASTSVTEIGASFGAQASAALAYFVIGMNMNIEAGGEAKFNFSTKFKDSVTFGAVAYGGNPTALATGDYGSWADSVAFNPVGFDSGAFSTFKNVSEYIADDAKAKHVQEATEEYLAEVTKDLPSMADGVANDGSLCVVPPGANLTFGQLPKPSSQRGQPSGQRRQPAPLGVRGDASDVDPPILPVVAKASLHLGDSWNVKSGERLNRALSAPTFANDRVWLNPYENETAYRLPDAMKLSVFPATCFRGKAEVYASADVFVDAGFKASFDFFSLTVYGVTVKGMFQKYAQWFDAAFAAKGGGLVSLGLYFNFFTLEHDLSAPPSAPFAADVDALPSSGGDASYDALVGKWGSHYVAKELIGAGCNFTVEYDIAAAASMSASEVQSAASASIADKYFGPMGIRFDLWNTVKKSKTDRRFSSATRKIGFSCFGGDTTILGTPEQPKPDSFQAWAKSASASPAPMPNGLRFRPLTDLVRQTDPALQQSKRDGVNAAITRLLSAQPVEPMAAAAEQLSASAATAIEELKGELKAQPPVQASAVGAARAADRGRSGERALADAAAAGAAAAPFAAGAREKIAWRMVPGVCNGHGGVGVGCGYDATKLDVYGLAINPKRPVVQMPMCPLKCYLDPEAHAGERECWQGECYYDPPDFVSPTRRYRVPAASISVVDKPQAESGFTQIVSRSASEYDHESISSQSGSHGWLVKHHWSKNTIDFYHRHIEQNDSMTSQQQFYAYHDVSLYPLPEPTPTLEFGLAALKLPLEYKGNEAQYREFIDDFGTHYMTQATMGALVLATTYFHSCLLDVWSGEKITEQSSSSFFGIWGDSHAGGHGHNKTDERFYQFSETVVQLLGGDAQKHGKLTRAKKLNQTDIDEWKQSITGAGKMVPISFQMKPIFDLVKSQVKKENLNRTMHDYYTEVGSYIESMVQAIKPIDPSHKPSWCTR